MYLCSTRIEEKIHHIMRGHLSFEEEYRAVVENYIRIADKSMPYQFVVSISFPVVCRIADSSVW